MLLDRFVDDFGLRPGSHFSLKIDVFRHPFLDVVLDRLFPGFDTLLDLILKGFREAETCLKPKR